MIIYRYFQEDSDHIVYASTKWHTTPEGARAELMYWHSDDQDDAMLGTATLEIDIQQTV